MSTTDSRFDTVNSTPSYRPGVERFFLVGVSGVASGLEFALDRSETLIGRSTACDICLSDERVSRRHVSLTLVPDPVRPTRSYVLLEDLGSRNGVRVGSYLVGSTLLEGGEKLVVGGSVFRVERRDELDRAHHARQRALLSVEA